MRRPLLRSAERNDASFAKRDEYAAMIHAGNCLSPQTPRNSASFEKRDEYAAMVQGGSCLSPQTQKERHFLRETCQICRDGSGWQESFSASAERNDASFAKRVKSAAMVQGGNCLSLQAPRNSASFAKRGNSVSDNYPGALFSSASAKGMRISCALRRRRSPRPPQRRKIPYFASSRKAGMTSWICAKGH